MRIRGKLESSRSFRLCTFADPFLTLSTACGHRVLFSPPSTFLGPSSPPHTSHKALPLSSILYPRLLGLALPLAFPFPASTSFSHPFIDRRSSEPPHNAPLIDFCLRSLFFSFFFPGPFLPLARCLSILKGSRSEIGFGWRRERERPRAGGAAR